MPGLNLGGMGSVRASAGFNNPAPPSTAGQAAFGPAYGSMPSSSNALIPNDPFGVSLWSAVTAAIILLIIRHSLPA